MNSFQGYTCKYCQNHHKNNSGPSLRSDEPRVDPTSCVMCYVCKQTNNETDAITVPFKGESNFKNLNKLVRTKHIKINCKLIL